MRTRLVAISAAALSVLSIGLAGCSSADTAAPTAAVQGPAAAAAAPSSPERVDPATFASVVASSGVTVIDVRRPDEFAAGHLEGAVNYNVEGPDFASQVGALDPAGVYAVYCHTGNRSKVAVATMTGAGITGIYELADGIASWEAAGLPIVS